MKRKRFSSIYSSNASEVDLTPMLDVVFILLIFFIVTASFVKEKTLDMAGPSNDAAISKNVPATLITVADDDVIYIDERAVSPSAVRAILVKTQTEQNGVLSVVVNAHEKSSTQAYMTVSNAARQVNGAAVALRTFVY